MKADSKGASGGEIAKDLGGLAFRAQKARMRLLRQVGRNIPCDVLTMF
jgi:hypothetical protein